MSPFGGSGDRVRRAGREGMPLSVRPDVPQSVKPEVGADAVGDGARVVDVNHNHPSRFSARTARHELPLMDFPPFMPKA